MRVTIERTSRKEMRNGYRWRVKVFDAPDPECIEAWDEYVSFRTLPEAKREARERRRYAHFHNEHAAKINATYFADVGDGLDSTCGGTGTLTCYCGGDQCVCGNNGEAECLGCADCDDSDYASDDEGDEEAAA